MMQVKSAGVQQQTITLGLNAWVCVERITHNGVTQSLQVNPQLVRASCHGFKLKASVIKRNVVRQHLIARLALFAPFVVNDPTAPLKITSPPSAAIVRL